MKTRKVYRRGSIRRGGILLALALVLVAACDTTAPEAQENGAEDATLQAVAEALTTELDLSAAQVQEITGVLTRHEGEGVGALWYVAAELQERLTEEQKARLFARAAERREAFRARMAEGAPGHLRGQRRMRRAGAFFRGAMEGPLAELLTEEQKAALAEVRARRQEAMRALIEQKRDGTLTPEAFREQMKSLFEDVKAEVGALLTEEQKAALEARRAEGREALRARAGERLEAMAEALELTPEQETTLRELRETHRAAMKAFMEEAKAGERDREEIRAAVAEMRAAQRAEMAEALTDRQEEIVRLHRILTVKVRAHRRGAGEGGFRQQRRFDRRNGG
ncbi:Spy/CpxP family protein refolding chaperone [Rhodocaloribacter sp.]